ncbi:uncharacterized protein LOC111391539 [Olea europaea var. sylvestris]|uniref:uncharacterized protein LOC111391539 n=1 Tax=Olea europaea var. sylvestris TaxID=158386 RepID=UPI000C1D46D8|nr:uncharacterized protein LOC111391539 [Olea europaea var. sylvestris]
MRNIITSVPERYILRRWRRDICRAHTRVAMNYDSLVSTPGQLRYDRMCKEFATLADVIAKDEEQTRVVIDWIRLQCTDTVSTKLFSRGISISLPSLHLESQSRVSFDLVSGSIKDPKCSKRKGAPQKLHTKSPLESGPKKSKATSPSTKGQRSRSRKSNLQHDTALNAEHSISTPLSCSQVILGN